MRTAAAFIAHHPRPYLVRGSSLHSVRLPGRSCRRSTSPVLSTARVCAARLHRGRLVSQISSLQTPFLLINGQLPSPPVVMTKLHLGCRL